MEDALAALSREAERAELKQAILECTRAEVVRALNDILLGGNDAPRSRDPLYVKLQRAEAGPGRRRRPRTAGVAPEGAKIDIGHRPRTSQARPEPSGDGPVASQALTLDSICAPTRRARIDRPSSNLLEKSSAIIARATGEPPKTLGNAFRHDGGLKLGKEASPHSRPSGNGADTGEDEHRGSAGSVAARQREEPWQGHSRPTTATRMLYASRLALRNEPSKRRPLTTTALERRKPPPSIAALQRSKAQEISHRLLGPFTIDRKRSNQPRLRRMGE